MSSNLAKNKVLGRNLTKMRNAYERKIFLVNKGIFILKTSTVGELENFKNLMKPVTKSHQNRS